MHFTFSLAQNFDDRWFLFVNGRWPNPTRQDKKGALAISPSILILTEIARGVVAVTIRGLAVEAPVVALLRWLLLLPVLPLFPPTSTAL